MFVFQREKEGAEIEKKEKRRKVTSI